MNADTITVSKDRGWAILNLSRLPTLIRKKIIFPYRPPLFCLYRCFFPWFCHCSAYISIALPLSFWSNFIDFFYKISLHFCLSVFLPARNLVSFFSIIIWFWPPEFIFPLNLYALYSPAYFIEPQGLTFFLLFLLYFQEYTFLLELLILFIAIKSCTCIMM